MILIIDKDMIFQSVFRCEIGMGQLFIKNYLNEFCNEKFVIQWGSHKFIISITNWNVCAKVFDKPKEALFEAKNPQKRQHENAN